MLFSRSVVYALFTRHAAYENALAIVDRLSKMHVAKTEMPKLAAAAGAAAAGADKPKLARTGAFAVSVAMVDLDAALQEGIGTTFDVVIIAAPFSEKVVADVERMLLRKTKSAKLTRLVRGAWACMSECVRRANIHVQIFVTPSTDEFGFREGVWTVRHYGEVCCLLRAVV
jgi:hypothetical protein